MTALQESVLEMLSIEEEIFVKCQEIKELRKQVKAIKVKIKLEAKKD